MMMEFYIECILAQVATVKEIRSDIPAWNFCRIESKETNLLDDYLSFSCCLYIEW